LNRRLEIGEIIMKKHSKTKSKNDLVFASGFYDFKKDLKNCSKMRVLPVVGDKKQARDGDGQLQGDPVTDEVGYEWQKGCSNSEGELSQDTKRSSELGSANFGH
jgi:hypothetical protein